MDSEQLRVTGLTGVDITLDIAGAGSRSYAFVIDWHIRLLIALAWFFIAFELYQGGSHSGGHSGGHGWRTLFGMTAVLPAVAIFLLYHPVLEVVQRGRTPGKRMAGVRIVTRQGGTPSVGALLIRNVFRLIDSLPFVYLVGLLCCLLTSQRVRIGDLAAGTLLVLDQPNSAKTLSALSSMVSQSGLSADLAELVDDLLQRWHSLDVSARGTLARTVLARADKEISAQTLAAITDSELRERLQSLLAGRA